MMEQESNELPKSWTLTTIDDIVGENGLFCDGDWVESKDQDINGEVRLIQLADIGDGIFRDRSNRFLNYETAKRLNCTFLNNGDVLIARMPDPIGRSCIFPYSQRESYVTVVDVAVIRTGDTGIDSKFIVYAINNRAFRNEIEKLQSGTTRKRISRGNLSEIKFPLPPLAEQHRIVAKIEELFSELDKGIETLKTAQQQLKVYRQAVLKYAFEGRFTNADVKEGELPEGWVVKEFGSITENFDGQRVPLSKIVRSSRKGLYRYYGATEIVDHIDDFLFEGKYLLIGEDGANLLSKSKPLSQIVEGRFWVNNHAHVVQAINGVSIDYLCHYFNSLLLNEYVSGTAQPKLTQANMNKIPIVLSNSYDEQERIVQEIESRLSVCDKIEEDIQQGLKQAEALRQSILKKAFEGKLVPQDPNDEPASVLLARIKAEREASPEKKSRTRKAKA